MFPDNYSVRWRRDVEMNRIVHLWGGTGLTAAGLA